MKYNGWKNRATWNVMLWLDNDEPAYRNYQAAVKGRARLSGVLAKAIARDAIGDSTPDGISLSNSRIDWREIADAMTTR